MIKGKIEFEGNTLSDVELAIDEAEKKIMQTYTSGFDSSDDGNYSFEVEGEEEQAGEEELGGGEEQ